MPPSAPPAAATSNLGGLHRRPRPGDQGRNRRHLPRRLESAQSHRLRPIPRPTPPTTFAAARSAFSTAPSTSPSTSPKPPVWIFPCAYIPGRPTIVSGSSIYPAVQNLMLAARSLGIGTTLTTIYRRDNARVNALLNLPEGWDTAALIPLGYPEGRWGTAVRQPVETVTYGDRFGHPFFPTEP
ncbi:MAG: nitroreductase family protein [Thermomicrobiales bacterium]